MLIVGAGPGGMLLAWLLARSGVPVHVIERHRDFAREFRGEGIQVSVIRHLDQLGLTEAIAEAGAGTRARAARVFFRERPVAVLEGLEPGSDFGLILHQERFLALLDRQLRALPHYRISMGTRVTGLVKNEGRGSTPGRGWRSKRWP